MPDNPSNLIVFAPVAASAYATSTEAFVSNDSDKLQHAALHNSAPVIFVVCNALTRFAIVLAPRAAIVISCNSLVSSRITTINGICAFVMSTVSVLYDK